MMHQRMLGEFLLRDQLHEAEAARVVVGNRGAVLHVKDDVIVCGASGPVLCVNRSALAVDREAAGHAEMHQQHVAARQAGQKVFAAALQTQNLAAAQTLGEIIGQGETQVGPMLLDAGKGMPFKGRQQAAADDLDLGKLRHWGASVSLGAWAREHSAEARASLLSRA
ncbi:protein of unknown function [Hyphomicrobium sp. 1Nfss2.1]